MFAKFQGQKIHRQKIILNLPTLVAVENVSLLPTLTTSQSLNFCFCHEIFGKKTSLC
jgi:hypothetical protein